MKPSDTFTAVSSVMTRKRGTALAVAAVAICLLLGVGMAQAQPTVIKDGADPSRAIGIQNLDIDGTLYNAQFPFSNVAGIYGPFPGSFTFDNEEAAIAAMEAINDALSADGNIRKVGCSDCPGPDDYWIGYDSNLEEDPDADDSTELAITVRSGLVPDIPTNEWEIEVTDVAIRYDNIVTWADFTLVPEGGNGNLPPTASPGDPYRGVVGEDVAFDGTGSSDPDGTIESYEWDFGDGGTDDSGPTPSYTYEAPGTYIVTLTVTDNDDVPDSETTTVSIIGRDENQAMADAGEPYFGTPRRAVSFDGTGSTPPDGIETYEWQFGDGEIGEGPTPSHRYDVFGEYIVTLKVTTEAGWFDMDATTVSIGAGNLPPNADANGPYTGRVGEEITFDGRKSRDPNGDTLTYEWHFGDGSDPITSAEPIVKHIYTEPNNYNVILIVTDDADVKNSNKTSAVIRPEPEDNQRPVCFLAAPSIATISVANDRLIPINVEGVTDPDGDAVSITIDSIYQDERVGRRPDGRGVGTDTAHVRAQRSKISRLGNGRVYHIGFTAEDERGLSCSGEVTVAVPLGWWIPVFDDGPNFDSTVPSGQ